jgi:transcription elongation GreA/GreB family factor
LARVLLKAREAYVVRVQLPGGVEELEIVEISYCSITLD